MAGKLGSANLTAGVDTLLWTNGTTKVVTANIRFCNRTASDGSVRVAISTSASAPALEEYITYDAYLRGNGILEDTGIRIDPNEKLWVRSNSGAVSVRAFGA